MSALLLSLSLAIILITAVDIPASAASQPLDECNVVWNTPGSSSQDSMPIGNGDLAMNAWVEENGDLRAYVSKTDAWSEIGRLLKLCGIRLELSPNPFVSGSPYLQTLNLQEGVIKIEAGEGTHAVAVKIWIDANHETGRIQIRCKTPHQIVVKLEVWRTKPHELDGKERFSAYGLQESPQPVIESADTILPAQLNSLRWYHRNPSSIWAESMRFQGFGDLIGKWQDPILHRTFGGAIEGTGLLSSNNTTLVSSKPITQCNIAIQALTKITNTPEEWEDALSRQIIVDNGLSKASAWKAHKNWWARFWQRSYIRVSGGNQKDTALVTRSYTLQRYISACAGRGAYPIKFNGSLFTVDPNIPGEMYSPDYRRWGGPYWFQNTRLAYWPMLDEGDFDMMQPLFRMYLQALPFCELRVQRYFHHQGAYFPETMYFWGAYTNDDYGWDRKDHGYSYVASTWIGHYYSDALELLTMGLDAYRYTQNKSFLTGTYLPLARAVLTFYADHYKSVNGKMVMEPAQALETWQKAINPAPDIAGLRHMLASLLAMRNKEITSGDRAAWQSLLDKTPLLPIEDSPKGAILAPAEKTLEPTHNIECPELYAVFPYRIYGVGRPDIELARRTYFARLFTGHEGWRQDEIDAADLGLTEEAERGLIERYSQKPPGRFPAFWGPNFDWIPDQDHGCAGQIALQQMLMQTVGHRILLFPAWPKKWNVSFKLHAPFRTVVEGIYRNGKLEELRVTPENRRKDVEILEDIPAVNKKKL